MSSANGFRAVRSKFQIPDPNEPTPEDQRGLGPSGKLIDFVPTPLRTNDVIGRPVTEVCPHVGTYGMGGPGYFGLCLGDEWLVFAIWMADNWLVYDGQNVGDAFFDKYGREKPLITDDQDDLSPKVVGRSLVSVAIHKHSCAMEFDDGTFLGINEEPTTRPLHEGSQEPRQFHSDEDLRKAIFLAPTIEIWI